VFFVLLVTVVPVAVSARLTGRGGVRQALDSCACRPFGRIPQADGPRSVVVAC